jgi:hypothetical protein
LVRGFGQTVWFAGTQFDQAVAGGKRRVVGVDSIDGEMGGRRDFDDLRAGGFQLATECCMLGLGGGEIGWVVEA